MIFLCHFVSLSPPSSTAGGIIWEPILRPSIDVLSNIDCFDYQEISWLSWDLLIIITLCDYYVLVWLWWNILIIIKFSRYYDIVWLSWSLSSTELVEDTGKCQNQPPKNSLACSHLSSSLFPFLSLVLVLILDCINRSNQVTRAFFIVRRVFDN